MKTAIEEAIELANEGINASMPNWWWKRKLTELLSKEKEHIIDAYVNGGYADCLAEQKLEEFAEQYYNQNFNK
jgi:uncharacterized protein (UPF0216 family)